MHDSLHERLPVSTHGIGSGEALGEVNVAQGKGDGKWVYMPLTPKAKAPAEAGQGIQRLSMQADAAIAAGHVPPQPPPGVIGRNGGVCEFLGYDGCMFWATMERRNSKGKLWECCGLCHQCSEEQAVFSRTGKSGASSEKQATAVAPAAVPAAVPGGGTWAFFPSGTVLSSWK